MTDQQGIVDILSLHNGVNGIGHTLFHFTFAFSAPLFIEGFQILNIPGFIQIFSFQISEMKFPESREFVIGLIGNIFQGLFRAS